MGWGWGGGVGSLYRKRQGMCNRSLKNQRNDLETKNKEKFNEMLIALTECFILNQVLIVYCEWEFTF